MRYAVIKAGLVLQAWTGFALPTWENTGNDRCTYFARMATNSGRKRHSVASGCTSETERRTPISPACMAFFLIKLVALAGFEPATHGLGNRRSIP